MDNHPSYDGMEISDSYPQPVLVGGSDGNTKNTDESKDDEVERTFEGEEMTYAPSNEPTDTINPYQSTIKIILSHLGKKWLKPTLLFKRGDCIGG